MWFDGVTLLPRLSSQHLAQVTFTRLNSAYRPAFNLACMFLTQESPRLQAGRTPVFAFLFDMKEDPGHFNNIAADKPAVVKEMYGLTLEDAGGELPDYSHLQGQLGQDKFTTGLSESKK